MPSNLPPGCTDADIEAQVHGYPQTLDDAIAEAKQRLDEFRQFWLDGMRDNPEAFPGLMLPGEWDEQIRCYDGG